MRDPKRINEMLIVLGQVWKANPDMRLTQLLAAVHGAGDHTDLFYKEDDVTLKKLIEFDKKYTSL